MSVSHDLSPSRTTRGHDSRAMRQLEPLPLDAIVAEQQVRLLVSSWNSQFCHTLTLARATDTHCAFALEWSRRPTPHEPMPDIRVHMTVIATNTSDSSGVTYRYDGECTVHTMALNANIDHQILARLKANTEFHRTHPITLAPAVAKFVNSRLTYQQYQSPIVPIYHSVNNSGVLPSPVCTAKTQWSQMMQALSGQPVTYSNHDEKDPRYYSKSVSGGDSEACDEWHGKAYSGDSTKPMQSSGDVVPSIPITAAQSDTQPNTNRDLSGRTPSNEGSVGVTGPKNPTSLEYQLVDMFRAADTDQSGKLELNEILNLLFSFNLALSRESLEQLVTQLMSEYDENNDGQLVWAEFLPVALDLIQASKAAKAATCTIEQQCETNTAYITEIYATLKTNESALHTAMSNFIDQWDPNHHGLLTLPQFRSLCECVYQQINEREFDFLVKQFERNANNDILYQPFYQHTLTFVVDIIEQSQWQSQASSLELFLYKQFNLKDAANNGYLSSRELMTVFAGVRSEIKLELSSTQLFVIINENKPANDEYQCKHFARKAALMITKLFDKQSMKERETFANRGSVAPIALLTSKDRARVEQELKQKFLDFDSNGDGLLDAKEFADCLADTSLCLSTKQIDELLQEAMSANNTSGKLHVDEFMSFAYTKLLDLAREARIQQLYVNIKL